MVTVDTSYMTALCERLGFPAEAIAFLKAAEDRILADQTASALMADALWAFEAADYRYDGQTLRHRRIGELTGVHEYTVSMLFLLHACKGLEARYAANGFTNSLFIETMTDLTYKLMECKQVKGVWGVFCANWYPGFFRMERFSLGRFQYERITFPHECFGADGHYLYKGDTVLNFHIPSSGAPLTREVRYDSYRRAKDFFFPDAPVAAFACSSWLLWPGYESHLPDKLNLKDFRHDFAILHLKPREGFDNAWRVFGGDAEKPVSAWPRQTSQQRAFADYCAAGLPHGSAEGYFFFDGEKVIK